MDAFALYIFRVHHNAKVPKTYKMEIRASSSLRERENNEMHLVEVGVKDHHPEPQNFILAELEKVMRYSLWRLVILDLNASSFLSYVEKTMRHTLRRLA
jgi:hypothetical protein